MCAWSSCGRPGLIIDDLGEKWGVRTWGKRVHRDSMCYCWGCQFSLVLYSALHVGILHRAPESTRPIGVFGTQACVSDRRHVTWRDYVSDRLSGA